MLAAKADNHSMNYMVGGENGLLKFFLSYVYVYMCVHTHTHTHKVIIFKNLFIGPENGLFNSVEKTGFSQVKE